MMNAFISGRTILGLFVALTFSSAICAQTKTASVTESSIEIPTYLLGSEDPNPPFQLLNEHGIYPYTMLDDLTDVRKPKTYRAIFLENEFLRATILPELGGRLYSLYDKVAKREVFYRNNSVKYGLVALRGAWISGGIEFNFPNGHTTDTVSPVSSRCLMNADGSATVVIGDVDQVSEMYWEVALTLHPGVSRLDEHVQLFNPTPVEHLYWFWNNAAVRATEDARFIYPMRLVTPGAGAEPQTFPEWHGVDHSRYASFHEPSELFGIGVHRDFFGVYYADADYGVIHYADHRELTGKKFWTWGVAGDGTVWTDLLTDTDGPYNEIQAGRFETQFHRDFMPVHSVESWSESWYPVKQLDGGFVEATSQFAINVRFLPHVGGKGDIEVAVNPTEESRHITLQIVRDGATKKSFSDLSFDAASPRTFVVSVDDIEPARSGTGVNLLSESGRVLLHWSASDPVDGNVESSIETPPIAPRTAAKQDPDVEELYLRGVDQDKQGEHEASLQQLEEVLKRSADYVPALRKLAMQEYSGGDFESARQHIERAIERDKSDAETMYDAGVIWRAGGDVARASDAFWDSIRLGKNKASAFIALGEMALSGGRYTDAEALLRRALTYEPDDGVALSDLSVALRLDGRLSEAGQVATHAATSMPLHPLPLAEQWRVAASHDRDSAMARAAHEDWSRVAGDRMQNWLEAASWYFSLNDFDSAEFVLKAAIQESSNQAQSPMVFYYLASCMRHLEREEEARAFEAKASAGRYDKIFINRTADAEVLQEAIAAQPEDTHAQYLLGNYMFQHRRYEEAERLWSRAKDSGFEYSVLFRNLGVYAWKINKNLEKAKALYEQAVQSDPQDYRLYVDLDEIDAQLGNTEARAKLFEQAPSSVLTHDPSRIRYAVFLLKQGKNEQALSVLSTHRFKPWEQGVDVHEVYVAAYIQKGRAELSGRRFTEAEADFSRALDYPANLGVGKPDKPNDGIAHYWLGEALYERGKLEDAHREWKALIDEAGGNDLSKYYVSLALERMGKKSEAAGRLMQLAQGPEHGREGAHNYFVAGLAMRHLGHESQAASYLHKAVEIAPSLWQAEADLYK